VTYIEPEAVISPKANWALHMVVLDKGEHAPAYALGFWDGVRVVAYRLNGHNGAPLGIPNVRGNAIWIIMDSELYPSILEMVERQSFKKAAIMRGFLEAREEEEQT
jgi:hypothetical protein